MEQALKTLRTCISAGEHLPEATWHAWKDRTGVAISESETAYLCAAVSEYFVRPVTAADVVWSYAGVRPLYDDGAGRAQEATRDYVLEMDAPAGQAPLLSVFGG